jgi:hypothetical protein
MNFRMPVIAACTALLLASAAMLAAEAEKAPAPKAAEKMSSEPAKTSASCKATTGTRIQSKKKDGCEKVASQPIRSYSAEELESTGKLKLAEALKELDPAVR